MLARLVGIFYIQLICLRYVFWSIAGRCSFNTITNVWDAKKLVTIINHSSVSTARIIWNGSSRNIISLIYKDVREPKIHFGSDVKVKSYVKRFFYRREEVSQWSNAERYGNQNFQWQPKLHFLDAKYLEFLCEVRSLREVQQFVIFA